MRQVGALFQLSGSPVRAAVITTLNLNNLFQNLVFQKLNTCVGKLRRKCLASNDDTSLCSAFLIQEYITIIDSTVSLIESVDTSTNGACKQRI